MVILFFLQIFLNISCKNEKLVSRSPGLPYSLHCIIIRQYYIVNILLNVVLLGTSFAEGNAKQHLSHERSPPQSGPTCSSNPDCNTKGGYYCYTDTCQMT